MPDETDILPDSDVIYGEPDDHARPVHVHVTNRQRVEPLPAGSFLGRTIAFTTANPIRKIAPHDPKRRRLTLSMIPLGAGVTGILVSNKRSDVDVGTLAAGSPQPQGFLITSPNTATIRWPFEHGDELWGRAVLASAAGGTFAGWLEPTDDALMPVGLETWTG